MYIIQLSQTLFSSCDWCAVLVLAFAWVPRLGVGRSRELGDANVCACVYVWQLSSWNLWHAHYVHGDKVPMPSPQRDVRIFSTINRTHLKFLNPETCSSIADCWLFSLPHASQAIQFNWPAPFLPKAENWNPFRWESSGHLLSMATAVTLCIVHSLLSAQLRYTFSASVCVCVCWECLRMYQYTGSCLCTDECVSMYTCMWICRPENCLGHCFSGTLLLFCSLRLAFLPT